MTDLQDLATDLDAKTLRLPPALSTMGGSLLGSKLTASDAIIRFGWPRSLYIPRQSPYQSFWITPPPDRNRYARAWPAVGNGVVPDWANADTGELFTYAILPFDDAGRDPRSEAGIGVLYTPDFTLGTVDFEPSVLVKGGTVRTKLNYPQASSGSVTLTASLILAMWQVIPGGYDLVDHVAVTMASIRRDKTFGAERTPLASLVVPRRYTKRFVVQKGRDYLFGAVGRVAITSTLLGANGSPLSGVDVEDFSVYLDAQLAFPSMSVDTAQVYIP